MSEVLTIKFVKQENGMIEPIVEEKTESITDYLLISHLLDDITGNIKDTISSTLYGEEEKKDEE